MKYYLKIVSLIFLVAFSSCEEKNFEMDLPEVNFKVNSTGSLTDLVMGERVQISYEIEEEGITNFNDYTLVFSSSQNGFLTVNSRDYLAGEKIEVPSLNFIAFYTPTASGEHEITSKITASSNNDIEISEVSVAVEGAQFEFNVAAPNEVTVGETIDLDFVIDEVIGDSDFDISYAFTGVNAEFRDTNNVVLQANQNYDVDNTFNWTLKGIEQGTMELTFKVKNQFGIEKTKTIPIEIKPIDFDFSVEPVGTVFELGGNIPFQINMDAPNSLTYQIKFDANTDGKIRISDVEKNENVYANIQNTAFSLRYLPSISGNAVINFTIRGSNGVEKTKSVNFQITEKPEITSIEIDSRFHSTNENTPIPFSRPNCIQSGPNKERSFKILVRWKKAPNTSIVSINLRINGQNRVGLFNPELFENSSEATYIYSECYRGNGSVPIEATITDSRGQTSKTFEKTL